MSENKLIGRIAYVSKQHDFGFINLRHPDGCMEKFFFAAARVIFSEVEQDEILPGHWARFAVSDQPPKHPGDAKFAVGVEIFIQAPVDPVESHTEVQS